MASAKVFINPIYLAPHYSSKIWRGYKTFLDLYYSTTLFGEICNQLKVPEAFVLQDGNWLSNTFADQFIKILKEKTGDQDIARKVGAFTIDPRSISDYDYFILKTIPLIWTLSALPFQTTKLNKFHNIKVHKSRPGHFSFSMIPKFKEPTCEDVFLNTEGILQALCEMYKVGTPNINSIRNSIRPDEVTFDVKYKISIKPLIKFTLSLALIFLVFTFQSFLKSTFHIETGSVLLDPLLPWTLMILAPSLFLLAKSALIIKHNHNFQIESNRKADEIYQSKIQLERRYQEANLLKQLSSELISCADPHGVIETCLKSNSEKFNYKRAAVFLLSKERQRLYLANSVGFDPSKMPRNIEFIYPNPDTKDGFIATVLDNGKTTLVRDIETYKTLLKPQYKQLLEALRVGSLIISPIQSGAEKFGVLVLIKESEEESLQNEDKFLVENITSQLSLYFESSSNFENEKKLRQIFQKYVPKQVLDQIGGNIHTSDGSLKPQKKEICSIFMDLRGFTTMCDGLAPERAFDLINLFAQFVTGILSERGAIVDNIIGDEVVSFFIKGNDESYILKGLESAAMIAEQLSDFNVRISNSGFSSIRLGIGLHIGEASVGSVGGDAKMNYTALGSTVNIASRLQSISKKFSSNEVSIVVSKHTLEILGSQLQFEVHQDLLRGTSDVTSYCVLDPYQIRSVLAEKTKKPEAA